MTLFSLAGSHDRANRTVSQEKEKGRMITATSGQKCLESFRRLNQSGLWAKTFAELLVGQEGWYSSKCRLTWKLSGTKYKRLYFQLVPSTRPTEEIGFGLLPTNQARDWKGESNLTNGKTQFMDYGLLPTPCQHNENGRSEGWSPSLLQVVSGLLPTPKARVPAGSPSERKRNTPSMETLAVMRMLPTPTAVSDAKGGCTRSDESRQNDTLAHAPHGLWGTGKTSQLNDLFVNEMMGFPIGWLDI